jgi:hypothetical protein
LHSALDTQGVNVEQGFLQSPLLFLTMQTSLLGQSLSSLHPSSCTGSGTEIKWQKKLSLVNSKVYNQ